jgi:hypothetical protein
MSIFSPRPDAINPINPKSQTRIPRGPHPYTRAIGSSRLSFEGSAVDKIGSAKEIYVGQNAYEARHSEVNDPKEMAANKKIRRKEDLLNAVVPKSLRKMLTKKAGIKKFFQEHNKRYKERQDQESEAIKKHPGKYVLWSTLVGPTAASSMLTKKAAAILEKLNRE